MSKSRKFLSLIIFFMLLLISCSDGGDDTIPPPPPPAPPDSIYFHNITPDTSFTSADTFVLHGSGGFYYALPIDSSASYGFDVTNDGLEDFRFTIRQWYYFISASNPVGNYNYEIRFSGTTPGCEVKIPDQAPFPVAEGMTQNMPVDSTGTYVQQAWLMMINASAPFSCDFDGDGWIGFRVSVSDTTYYGWVTVFKNEFSTDLDGFSLTVKEWAITRTPGMAINTGQRTIIPL
jgi:hypothetical protein